MTQLKPGESSVMLRLRGQTTDLEWFSRLTATERGRLISKIYQAHKQEILHELSSKAPSSN